MLQDPVQLTPTRGVLDTIRKLDIQDPDPCCVKHYACMIGIRQMWGDCHSFCRVLNNGLGNWTLPTFLVTLAICLYNDLLLFSFPCILPIRWTNPTTAASPATISVHWVITVITAPYTQSLVHQGHSHKIMVSPWRLIVTSVHRGNIAICRVMWRLIVHQIVILGKLDIIDCR